MIDHSNSNKTFQQNYILGQIETWMKLSFQNGSEQYLGEMWNGLELDLEDYPGLPESLKPSVFFKKRLISGWYPRMHKVTIRQYLGKIHKYIDETTTKSLHR